jgi:hypothetical protein
MRKRKFIPETLMAQEPSCHSADFSAAESQRVLAAAASAVARELGRQAAREHFAELLAKNTKGKRKQT